MNVFSLEKSFIWGVLPVCLQHLAVVVCACGWLVSVFIPNLTARWLSLRPGDELHGCLPLSLALSLHSSASFAYTWSLKLRSSAGYKALSPSLHLSFCLPGHEYVAKPSERSRPKRKTGNLFAQCSFLRLSCGASSRAGNAAFSTFPQSLLWLIFKALLAAILEMQFYSTKSGAGVPRTSEHPEFIFSLLHELWHHVT